MNERWVIALTFMACLGQMRALADDVKTPVDSVIVRDIEEVVVVSTPKENANLRQQTLSSTSFSQDDMRVKGVASIKGISMMVPNLYIPTYGSKLTTATYIRGIGSRINTPAVGLYVDNIPYINKNAFDFNYSDIDRIDVLRGPQGTLYGRNTMGGLIRVYTKSPFNYQGTDLQLSAATYGDYKASVTHYHRISDKFAFSGGFFYDHQGGFYKNAYKNNEKVDDGNEFGARLRAVYLPGANTKLDFTLNYEYLKQGTYPYENMGQTDHGIKFENLPQKGKIAYNRESNYKRNLLNAGLNIEQQGNGFVFNSITGFQFLKDDMNMDQDYSPLDIFTLRQQQNGKSLSQEFVFKSSPNSSSIWHWTTGVSGFYEWLKTDAPVTFWSDGIARIIEGNVNSVFERLKAQNQRMPNMALDVTDDHFVVAGNFDTPTLNAALYHQSTFDITKKLSFTIGARLEYEKTWIDYDSKAAVNFDFLMPDFANNPAMQGMLAALKGIQVNPGFVGKLNKDDWQLLPKFALKYDFNGRSNIYASVSKGYRAGGYNIQMFSDLIQTKMSDDIKIAINEKSGGRMSQMAGDAFSPNVPDHGYDVNGTIEYKPETSWNYELGAHLTNAKHTLQADVAVFYIRTNNLQLAKFATTGMGRWMTNADKGNSYGAELSLRAQLTDALSMNVNYGYTYATFKAHSILSSNYESRSTYYVPFVPKHTFTLGAQYVIGLREVSFLDDITLSADYRGTGRIYWDEENFASQKFYGILNGQVGFRKGDINFDVWIHNALDKDYTAMYFENMGNMLRQKGTPLQVGVNLRYRF